MGPQHNRKRRAASSTGKKESLGPGLKTPRFRRISLKVDTTSQPFNPCAHFAGQTLPVDKPMIVAGTVVHLLTGQS